jgi:hypothetical protein
VTGGAEIDSAKNSKASRSHAFDWPASENDMAILRAMSRLPYGFSATTLPFFQKYMGVPCMRATLRAVFAARRIPRPTPAAKLSGSLRFFCVLRFAFDDRATAGFRFARFLPTD